jgi:hypothetical protein
VFAGRRGGDAPPLLLAAARRLEPLDAAMARDTYLEAFAAAMSVGRLGHGLDEREGAEAACASLRLQPAAEAADLLSARSSQGSRGGTPQQPRRSRRPVRTFERPDPDRHALAGVPPRAGSLGRRAVVRVATGAARVARNPDALNLLPNALNYLAALNVHSGAFSTLAALIGEVDAPTQGIGLPPPSTPRRRLPPRAAMRPGSSSTSVGATRPNGTKVRRSGCSSGTALRHNSYSRYSEALTDARQACEHEDVMPYGWALGRADRGRHPQQRARRFVRRTRGPERARPGERHRMSARYRGALRGTDERGGVLLPRIDRAARA